MTLPRLFYTLPELAQKWGKTENDLLHLAAIGHLKLSVKYLGKVEVPTWYNRTPWMTDIILIENEYVQLYNDACEGILEFGCRHDGIIRDAIWNNVRVTFGYEEPGRHFNFNFLSIPDTSHLHILPAEAARVESLYPELLHDTVSPIVQPKGYDSEVEMKVCDLTIDDGDKVSRNNPVSYLEGRNEILEFMGKVGTPPNWNTAKEWIRKHDSWLHAHEMKNGKLGGEWRISKPDAANIRTTHINFLTRKRTNSKK